MANYWILVLVGPSDAAGKHRITLIHATPVAIEPICASFKRLWPQAEVTKLLEDSLSADLDIVSPSGTILAVSGRKS